MGHFTRCKKKKGENVIFCDRLVGPGEHDAKFNQTEKDKHHMISLIRGI